MSSAMVREAEHEAEVVERLESLHVSDISPESFLKAAASLKEQVAWNTVLGGCPWTSGILHVLLHFWLKREDLDDVKETIRYMIRSWFGHSGNYPLSEGNRRDWLVQWSHGAGSVAIMLCKAAEVFPEDSEFHNAAIEAGEVVWKRGLNQRVGLCDGIAGNAYVFLSLYRLTKDDETYLESAKAFSGYLYHNAAKLIACSQLNFTETTYSLLQGHAGITYLWFDLTSPENARFPGFEL